VAEVRHILDRNGGNLGTSGSVAWQFDRQGLIYLGGTAADEDRVFEAAIEAGATDVKSEGGEFVVSTEAATFHEVQEGLRRAGLEIASAELSMVAKNEVDVGGKDGEKLLRLLEALDDHDDVQQVYSNANLDDDVLAEAL
ncbi:MAG: YebC/PmpR family DNA-binding transcriptional regulator, partial [Gemmatimonadota bacterium]|nr:YebC/PmpR family DNA-binding transcriptional regulator [Gemmatimonadota bacterium]